jgi:hypothetical protein
MFKVKNAEVVRYPLSTQACLLFMVPLLVENPGENQGSVKAEGE